MWSVRFARPAVRLTSIREFQVFGLPRPINPRRCCTGSDATMELLRVLTFCSLILVPSLLAEAKNVGAACGYCKYMIETFKNVSFPGLLSLPRISGDNQNGDAALRGRQHGLGRTEAREVQNEVKFFDFNKNC